MNKLRTKTKVKFACFLLVVGAIIRLLSIRSFFAATIDVENNFVYHSTHNATTAACTMLHLKALGMLIKKFFISLRLEIDSASPVAPCVSRFVWLFITAHFAALAKIE